MKGKRRGDKAFFFLALCFALIAGRLYALQIMPNQRLEQLNQRTQWVEMPEAARLGDILTDDGKIYATQIRMPMVALDPYFALGVEEEDSVLQPEARIALLVDALAPHLVLTATELREKIKKNMHRKYLVLQKEVSWEKARRLKELDIRGLIIRAPYKRVYPQGRTAASLLGFYRPDGGIGLEHAYRTVLRGQNGLVKKFLGQNRRVLAPYSEVIKPVVDGHSVTLTLHSGLQQIAEEVMREAYDYWKPKAAMCVVQNPQTGAILAMVNLPDFDPNKPGSDQELWRNWAVSMSFEPGSIFKPFPVALALDHGLVQPDTRIFCENGSYTRGKRTIHDVHPYGWLTVSEIVEKSSNPGVVKLGFKLGKDRLYDGLVKFGFGRKTGIDLSGEHPGIFAHKSRWSPPITGTMMSVPYGHEITCTSLQVVNAFSAIANGGLLMKPFVVKAIKDHTGKSIKTFSPQVVDRVLSMETTDRKVMPMLQKVVTQGTAKRTVLSSLYDICAKTGTAELIDKKTGLYMKNRNMASLVAFAPAQYPKLSIIVSFVDPQPTDGKKTYGGTVAGPLVKEILEKSLLTMGVRPKDEETTP